MDLLEYLPKYAISFTYFFAGDEEIFLQTYLLKSFAGKYLPIENRIYKYRLSRTRRCIENACMQYLAHAGKFFTIHAQPTTVDSIVKATVSLISSSIKMNDSRNGNIRYYDSNYTDNENKITRQSTFL